MKKETPNCALCSWLIEYGAFALPICSVNYNLSIWEYGSRLCKKWINIRRNHLNILYNNKKVDNMKKEKPNCALCYWFCYSDNGYAICSVNYTFASVVHNTKLCKKLFKRKSS